MSESKRIAQQMKQGFEKDCWAGLSLLEILNGIDYKMAAAKPIPNAHSIWELIMHLVSGQHLLQCMIRGEIKERIAFEDWWEPVPEQTEANWNATLERLKKQESELHALVESFPDDRLDMPFVEGGSTAYNNLHGHVQHMLYHGGQILTLKKVLGK